MDCNLFKKLYPQLEPDDRNEFVSAFCRDDHKMMDDILNSSGIMVGHIYSMSDKVGKNSGNIDK